MTHGLYIVLLLLKTTFPKCLVYKSSSGQFFAVKEGKSSQKCLNGVLLKSSSDYSLICLPNSATFSRNESLSCVIDDKGKNIQGEKDYLDDDEKQCTCGQENQRHHGNHEIVEIQAQRHRTPYLYSRHCFAVYVYYFLCRFCGFN